MNGFDWKRHYLAGDISFADALGQYLLESGAPEFLVAQYESAILAYQDGTVADLAEPFGIAMAKREKNAMKRVTLVSHIRFLVDTFHDQGYTKNNPENYADTAYHKAAELLLKGGKLEYSPSGIYDICRRG